MQSARKYLGLILLFLPMVVHGYTIVTSTSPVLEKVFLAQTTNQFPLSVLTPNPLAANTYTLQLKGPRGSGSLVGNAFTDCMAQGVFDGMDYERYEDLKIIQGLQLIDLSSGTCAGTIVDTTTAQSCQYIFNLIGNAISQRWLRIYSSSGAVVAP